MTNALQQLRIDWAGQAFQPFESPPPIALEHLAEAVDNQSPTSIDGILFADQFPSIQAAINALPLNGGMVVLGPGTYPLSATLTSSVDNTRLWARSWSTVLKRGDSLTGYTVNFSNNNCTIEGMAIDGNGTVVSTGAGEVGTSGTNCLIQNVKVFDTAGTIAIECAGADSRVTGCTVIGQGATASAFGYGIWANNHVKVRIDNNIVENVNLNGIIFDGSGSVVEGNQLLNCYTVLSGGGGAIYYVEQTAGLTPSAVSIANNTIIGGTNFTDGIELAGDNVTVTGNAIQGVGGFGIVVEGVSSVGRVIVGNVVQNVGTGGSIDGIFVSSNVGAVQIVGNRIIDNQVTHTMRDSIRLNTGSGDNFVIVGNVCTPNGQAGIVDNATGLNKVIGYNLGIDNVLGTLASAATITVPNTDLPIISLTGSVGVTSIAGTLWTGREITFLPTGAVVFTAGANISNTATTVAGVPMSGTWDGTKMWLK